MIILEDRGVIFGGVDGPGLNPHQIAKPTIDVGETVFDELEDAFGLDPQTHENDGYLGAMTREGLRFRERFEQLQAELG